MKRRSALDSLEDLRERALDAQRAALAEALRKARLAEEQARASQSELRGAVTEYTKLREAEQAELSLRGLRAADGQRRIVWEEAARQRLAALAEAAARHARAETSARDEQARATARLTALDGELKAVREEIDNRAERARRRAENSRQDALDDLSLHRFLQSRKPQ